ncbi:hypothetical protein HispidOSU_005486, partial [Sigmodon hispidus]
HIVPDIGRWSLNRVYVQTSTPRCMVVHHLIGYSRSSVAYLLFPLNVLCLLLATLDLREPISIRQILDGKVLKGNFATAHHIHFIQQHPDSDR